MIGKSFYTKNKKIKKYIDKIIRDTWILFRTKEEKKKVRDEKEINVRLAKDK